VPARAGALPRVAFVINSLAGGGAERVFCSLLEGLRGRLDECEAEVVLLDDEPSAYPPPDFLPVSTLNARGDFAASVAKLTGQLARFQPDVTLSFLSRANCANVIASRLCGHAAIISERVATADHFGAGPAGRLKRSIIRQIYRHADAVIAVSEGVRKGLIQHCRVPADRIEVISNPIDASRIRAQAAFAPPVALPDRFIVSVNRLIPNKNVPMQVDALACSGLPHDLVILGDGPERRAIETRAEALGIRGRVHLLGFAVNPFPVIARADIFVSTSNVEGFPNALAEAMALGVPCAATNCRSGPAEILADDPDLEISALYPAQYGVLSPIGDAGAFAEALRFLAQPHRRAEYAAAAAARAGVYQPELTVERYWRTIERVGGFAQALAPRQAPAVAQARARSARPF